MEQKTLSSISLTKAAQSNMPNRILEKINACLSEDESYAADELVGLAEEILNHIAAVGISNYLQSEQQKEVYNDFLIQLFTASSHDYNAGPLYRWAANMIADCSKLTTSNKFAFFWETLAGKVVLCQKINQLAELRNRVMHGFFVLPPEENKKQADAIGDLLLALQVSGFFLQEADFHFIQAGNFTGHWNILEDNHWQKLINDTPFGKLAQRIVIERSEVFWQQEALSTFSVKSNAVNLPDKFESFFNANTRGAYACWVHPADATKGNFYLAMAQWLLNQQNTITVAYTLHETGISFTDGFLLNRLAQVLNTSNKVLSGNKKIEDHVKRLRKDFLKTTGF